jgi:hypothetical protein
MKQVAAHTGQSSASRQKIGRGFRVEAARPLEPTPHGSARDRGETPGQNAIARDMFSA